MDDGRMEDGWIGKEKRFILRHCLVPALVSEVKCLDKLWGSVLTAGPVSPTLPDSGPVLGSPDGSWGDADDWSPTRPCWLQRSAGARAGIR